MGKYGKVTGFKAYVKEANSRKSVTFQLWKPVDLFDHMYELVAEYSFAVTSTGVNEVKVFELFILKYDTNYTFETSLSRNNCCLL